jgi:DNA-directed RNA polymerase subunit beta
MSAKNSNERISFRINTKNQLEYPDFLEIQLKSFMEFFNWIPLLKKGESRRTL